MKVISSKIKEILFEEKNYYIKCIDTKILKIDIINGSVNIDIKNNDNDYVSFYSLEKDDIIKIYYNEETDIYIVPKTIYTNTKYSFDSDSTISDNNI